MSSRRMGGEKLTGQGCSKAGSAPAGITAGAFW
jgi:hypothetical protein